MSLFFAKKGEFPEVSAYSAEERATLTPTGLVIGDEGTFVSITPAVCTIQSLDGTQRDSVSLTSKSVTTTTSLGSVERTWAQITAGLSSGGLPSGGTAGHILTRGADNSASWAAPAFVSPATKALDMDGNAISKATSLTAGDPLASHSIVSASSLSHTKISGADTATVTITGDSLGLSKNGVSNTFPWQDLVTAISTPPTLEAIVGVNDFNYLRLLGNGQMTTKMNFTEGSFSFEKIVNGVKTVGGLFPNGITYSSGPSTGSLATTLTLSLKENGNLLLADAHRTFFGGLESVILDSNGTYTIPANINLNFTITIQPVVKNIIAIDLQLGQIINIYNYGDANNKINNYSMGTNKLITCYYDGVLLNCSTSNLVSVTFPYEGTSYEC